MKFSKAILISLISLVLISIVVGFVIHRNNPIHKAHTLEMEGKYPEAVACLKSTISKDPNSANVWRELGNIYNITNKPKWALECFEQYVALRPDDKTMGKWVEAYRKSLEPKSLEPKYTSATIQIVNATISPAKEDGSKWNGEGVLPEILDRLGELLSHVNPYAAVAAEVGSVVLKPNEKPAPYGYIEVAINGQYQQEYKTEIGDRNFHTLTPYFRNVELNIPLNDGTRIRVSLFNADLIHRHHIIHRRHLFGSNNSNLNSIVTPPPAASNLDLIGVAEINSRDIANALESQKIYQVKVADQTQNQLLFIGIEARPIEETTH